MLTVNVKSLNISRGPSILLKFPNTIEKKSGKLDVSVGKFIQMKLGSIPEIPRVTVQVRSFVFVMRSRARIKLHLFCSHQATPTQPLSCANVIP